MNKRVVLFINLLMTFSLLLGSVSPAAAVVKEDIADKENIAYAVLGKDVEKKNIDKVSMGWSPKVTVTTQEEREAWQLTSNLDSSASMYVNLSDSMGNSKIDGSVYEVEIDYYDRDMGYFIVWYDSVDYGAQIAEEVYIDNSCTWKTASFTLDNAGFSNSIDGVGDLKISSRERGTMLPASSCNVYIGAIRIKRIPGANPLYVESYNDQPGNTYRWYDESKIVHNRITNVSGQDLEATVTFRIVDEDSCEQWQKSENIVIAAGEEKNLDSDIQTDRCGLYTYYIDVDTEVNGSKVHSTFKEDTIAIVKTDPDGIRSRFGWVSHFLDRYPDKRIDECLDLINMANMPGTRVALMWDTVENKSKGSFDARSTKPFKVIEMQRKKGLKAIMQFAFGNALYTEKGRDMPITDEEIEGFKGYVSYVTNLLKDSCDLYEIWNEPDIGNFNTNGATPKDLARLVKECAPLIKEINPNAQVASLSVTMIMMENRLNYWMKTVCEEGMLDYVDAITLHTYTSGGVPPEKANIVDEIWKYKNMAAEYGKENIPVWITEYGNTTAFSDNTSFNDQANWVTRAAILYEATDSADISLEFRFEDGGIIDQDREDNFGMVGTAYEKYNVEGKVAVPRQTYLAFAGMNYMLGGEIESNGIYDIGDNIHIKRFKSPKFGKDVVALWDVLGAEQVTLNLGTDSVDYYDRYGNKTTVYGKNGIFTFMLDESVGYIVGDFSDFSVVDNDSLINFETKQIEVTTGDTMDIRLKTNTEHPYKLEVEKVCDGAEVEENKGFVDGTASLKIFTGSADEMESKIIINVKDEEQIICQMRPSVVINKAADVSLSFSPKGNGNYNEWIGSVLVKNNSCTKSAYGYIEFQTPQYLSALGKIDIGCVPKGKTAAFDFDIPNLVRKGMYSVAYDIYINNRTEPISYNSKFDFTMATYTTNPPVVDGQMEKGEWPENTAMFADKLANFKKPSESMPMLWKGTSDLSTKVSLMWDEERLYLYSEVTDDIHCQTNESKDLWKGDGLQFGLFIPDGDGFVAAGQGNQKYNEFGIAMLPTGDGSATYRYRSQNGIPAGICEGAQTAVKRDNVNKKTIYEWSMKWSDITGDENFVPMDGQELGFSILWNDNDGDGRKGWMEYASGIGASKNTDLFTYLKLTK